MSLGVIPVTVGISMESAPTGADSDFVGRYRRGAVVGQGGTCAVFEAVEDVGGQPRVLKVANSLPARVALARELAILSNVRHPALVRLLDVVRADDGTVVALVLERAAGTLLSAFRRERGVLPWREAVRIVTRVASALHALHESGFVHCDVKPSNVCIHQDGEPGAQQVTVFDLGSAVAFRRWHASGPEDETMATAACSGDASLGLPLAPTSDVYSLAVMTFELLVGALPFSGDTREELLWRHIHREAPAVEKVDPSIEIPPHVVATIRRALAKQPGARHTSVLHFAQSLSGAGSTTTADRALVHEWEARRALVEAVRGGWIAGVLDSSSAGLPLIPQDFAVRFADVTSGSTPRPNSSLVDVFERAGGSLLITGAPGHGKTVQLLRLLRELLDRRTPTEEGVPIPVVLSMSEWRRSSGTIAAWLREELQTKYGVPSELARRWTETAQILPFFDGLDEVPVDDRPACLDAINAFLARSGAAAAITCRSGTPSMPVESIRARVVVELGPLADAATSRLLGGEWQPLRAAIAGSDDLVELARTPLMLHLLRSSITEGAFDALPGEGGSLVDWVYRQFIRASFSSRRGKEVVREEFEPKLTRVASTMKKLEHGVLLLEELQPHWLRIAGIRRLYLWASRGIVALVFTCAAIPSMVYTPLDNQGFELTAGFALALALAIAFWLTCTFVLWSRRPSDRFSGIPTILAIGVGVGLLTGVTLIRFHHSMVWVLAVEAGLMGAAVMGIARRHRRFPERDIATVEKLRWGWRSVPTIQWAVLLATVGVLAAVLTPFLSLRAGLFVGALVGAIGAAVAASRHELVVDKVTPNHGVHRSIRSAAQGAALGFVVTFAAVAVAYDLSYAPIAAMFPAVVGGLWFGGTDVIQHYVLRLCLAIERSLPFRTSRMLDLAVDLGFMRRVGNGYIFAHATLRDHLAGELEDVAPR